VRRKIPQDAFELYLAMGPGRSYQALARQLSVSKQAVTKLAGREAWQDRLEEIESRARTESDQHVVGVLAEMNERHLKVLRVVQGKALEALKEKPLRSGMDAVRALEMSIRHERVIRGEPSDRAELDVETVTRREMRRWMQVIDDEAGEGVPGEDGGAEAEGR
jgi:hypothetical protein